MISRASRIVLCAVVSAAATMSVRAVDLSQRSFSLSRQFVVYSEDRGARLEIATVVEEIKKGVLSLLGQEDRWQFPIVIDVQHANAADANQLASKVRLFATDEGFKVEFDICREANSLDVRFQQQLVRAILLEFAYRGKSLIKGGVAYAEPPQWLIEGIVAILSSREMGADADVFKTLIAANHLPPLKNFLTQNIDGIDTTSRKMYAACAMGLVQLLLDLPDGHAGLASYAGDLADHSADTVADLMKHFPALGGSDQSLEKRWVLSMARFSASDRYAGLSIEETEKRLTSALSLQISDGKNTESFRLDQFHEFLKFPASRPALARLDSGLLALQPAANPLFRPVVFDYQKIVADLERGKVRGIQNRLDAVTKYRESLLARMNDISDYLNWFEATQMTTRSDAFAGYFRAANEITLPAAKRSDPVSKYLDAVEVEFQ